MFKNSFTEEIKGMVFSVDLMLALIIITVILGISADAMDIASSKMEEYSHASSMERITCESADMLIETPGSPENWEELRDLNGVTPGLAEINPDTGEIQPKTLNIRKINRLKEYYDELINGRVLPPYCNSTLVIYPVDESLEPIIVDNNSVESDSTEIMVVNRTVLCNSINTSVLVFIKDVKDDSYLLEPEGLGEKCPHDGVNGSSEHSKVDYRNRKPGWMCYYFKVTQDILNSTDFYIITEPASVDDQAACWMIDRPENITENTNSFKNSPIPVNGRLKECMGNESTAVLWLHVFSSGNPDQTFNTYLAGFPKGTPPEKVKVQYLNPQPCYFVLKVWV